MTISRLSKPSSFSNAGTIMTAADWHAEAIERGNPEMARKWADHLREIGEQPHPSGTVVRLKKDGDFYTKRYERRA